MNHHIHQCKNGLHLIICEDHSTPLVSVQYWVETGSIHEAHLSNYGVSHLLEHMVFKGTEKYSGEELNQLTIRHGGTANAYTTTDRTVYHIDGPAEAVKPFTDILTQMVFFPTLDATELEKEKEVVVHEWEMYADDPHTFLYEQYNRLAYKVHPRRYSVLGDPGLMTQVTREDLAQYHSGRYTPANTFLMVCGDVNPSEIISDVEAQMACIPRRITQDVQPVKEPRIWGARKQVSEFDVPNTQLVLGWRIPSTNHPDFPALSLLCSILGSGRSALLYDYFHDNCHSVTDISSTIGRESGQDDSWLTIECSLSTEKCEQIRGEIVDFIRAASTLENLDEHIQIARSQYKMSQIKRMSTISGKAAALASSWHFRRNLQSSEEWISAIQKVTPEDIRRVASEWLCECPLIDLTVHPLNTLGKDETQTTGTAMEEPWKTVLSTGLTLMLRRDNRQPVIQASFVAKAGCPSESAANAGINTVLAEVMTKGCADRSAREVAREIEKMGGSLDCSTGNNTIMVSIRALQEYADDMLRLLADVCLYPRIEVGAVEQAKQDQITCIRELESDPLSVAFSRMRRSAYGNVSYGHTADGTVESISSLTQDEIFAHYRDIFSAENCVLSISGDFDVDEMIDKMECFFSDIETGNERKTETTPAFTAGHTRILMDKQQSVLVIGMPAWSITETREPELLLFTEWCNDMSGPLFSSIREKESLCYYVGCAGMQGLDAGHIAFYMGTDGIKVDDAREKLLEEIDKLPSTTITEETLGNLKKALINKHLRVCQNAEKVCNSVALNTAFGFDPMYFDTMPQRIAAVTVESFSAFVKEVLDPSHPRNIITICGEG